MKEDEKENWENKTISLRVSPTVALKVAKAATHLAKKTVGPALGDIMVSASPAAVAATGGGTATAGAVGSAFAGTALGTACAVVAPAGQAVGIAYGLMKICTAIWD